MQKEEGAGLLLFALYSIRFSLCLDMTHGLGFDPGNSLILTLDGGRIRVFGSGRCISVDLQLIATVIYRFLLISAGSRLGKGGFMFAQGAVIRLDHSGIND